MPSAGHVPPIIWLVMMVSVTLLLRISPLLWSKLVRVLVQTQPSSANPQLELTVLLKLIAAQARYSLSLCNALIPALLVRIPLVVFALLVATRQLIVMLIPSVYKMVLITLARLLAAQSILVTL